MNEYQQQANDFLQKHNMVFSVVYIGEDCPSFCEDAAKGAVFIPGTFPRKNHIHGSHWLLTLTSSSKNKALTIDFWDSYRDAELRSKRGRKAATPTPYDLLAILTKYEPGDFEDFCSEYGYDTDSRKAEAVYRAVSQEFKKVKAFFTSQQSEELQDIN